MGENGTKRDEKAKQKASEAIRAVEWALSLPRLPIAFLPATAKPDLKLLLDQQENFKFLPNDRVFLRALFTCFFFFFFEQGDD